MLNLGCGQYLRNPFFPGFWGQKWGCGLCILADYTRLYTVVNDYIYDLIIQIGQGAQWLSGRVLDLRLRGHEFEPHRHHYLVSLSKTH